MRLLALLVGGVLACGFCFAAPVDQTEEHRLAAPMLAAIAANQPYPVLSQRFNGFNLSQAYGVQRAVVQQAALPVVGFKAGLTTRKGQQRFAVTEPIAGVLLKPVLHSGDTLQQRHFHRLMLEPELAFRLQRKITAPVANVTALQGYFDALAPALELPDLGFEAAPKLLGVDVIASNAAANHVAISDWQPLPTVPDINSLTVELWRDGELLRETSTGEVMGDQWRALLWLVNHAVAQGYVLEPGQIFISGALGGMLPAVTGHYSLRIESLAPLEFSIAE